MIFHSYGSLPEGKWLSETYGLVHGLFHRVALFNPQVLRGQLRIGGQYHLPRLRLRRRRGGFGPWWRIESSHHRGVQRSSPNPRFLLLGLPHDSRKLTKMATDCLHILQIFAEYVTKLWSLIPIFVLVFGTV